MIIDNETLKQWAGLGPWVDEQPASDNQHSNFRPWVSQAKNNHPVALSCGYSREEAMATAKLIASAPTLAAEVLVLRQSIASCIDMIDNCAGVPRQPDSLPMMVLYELRQTLKGRWLMTTITPRLRRAVQAARDAIGMTWAGDEVSEHTRPWVQALIADLLLPDPPAPVDPNAEVITLGAAFDYGFAAYEHMIKARAGLVQEGVDV